MLRRSGRFLKLLWLPHRCSQPLGR